MPAWLTNLLPLEGLKIVLVLFLSFLVGLEREEHHIEGKGPAGYSFGGVRTFPLIGLIGYAMALVSGPERVPLIVGFAVVAAFLWLSYKHKLERYDQAGATTEISGLTIYIVGALVSRNEYWIGTTLAILCVLLLELKTFLEGLSRRLPADEILAFSKFLLLTAVILPIVPNQNFGPFAFNPFRTWLVVVAASGISYGSYLLQKAAKGLGGVYVSALLGGAYSSTVTTVILAKRAREEQAPAIYAGSILMASGVMYFRFLVLVALFNRELAARLLLPFVILGAAGIAAGVFWPRLQGIRLGSSKDGVGLKNPLELSAAFLFAAFFVLLLAVTHYAVDYMGRGGVYGLAALTGTTDPTPFILEITQSAGSGVAPALAASAMVIAAASNNFVKGLYAYELADRNTGRQALWLLLGLTVAGLAPLLF